MRINLKYDKDLPFPVGVIINGKAKVGASLDYEMTRSTDQIFLKIPDGSVLVKYIDTQKMGGLVALRNEKETVFIVDLNRCVDFVEGSNHQLKLAVVGLYSNGDIYNITGVLHNKEASYVNYYGEALKYDKEITEKIRTENKGLFILKFRDGELFVANNSEIIAVVSKNVDKTHYELFDDTSKVVMAIREGKYFVSMGDEECMEAEVIDFDDSNVETRIVKYAIFIDGIAKGKKDGMCSVGEDKKIKWYFQAFMDYTYLYLFNRDGEPGSVVNTEIYILGIDIYKYRVFMSNYVESVIRSWKER
jgi:hypothetical protein|nr:MAG TPA: hypothetical protein [Caudoviricetes sp.]